VDYAFFSKKCFNCLEKVIWIILKFSWVWTLYLWISSGIWSWYLSCINRWAFWSIFMVVLLLIIGVFTSRSMRLWGFIHGLMLRCDCTGLCVSKDAACNGVAFTFFLVHRQGMMFFDCFLIQEWLQQVDNH
jgi:hypothetical protein